MFYFSALLFLIVASENIQHNKIIGPDRNQANEQEENVSFIKNSKDQSELTDRDTKSNHKVSSFVKSKVKEQNFDLNVC